jgi:hypothetical protein
MFAILISLFFLDVPFSDLFLFECGFVCVSVALPPVPATFSQAYRLGQISELIRGQTNTTLIEEYMREVEKVCVLCFSCPSLSHAVNRVTPPLPSLLPLTLPSCSSLLHTPARPPVMALLLQRLHTIRIFVPTPRPPLL